MAGEDRINQALTLLSRPSKMYEMAYMTQSVDTRELNRVYPEDLPVHDWYRFVLSYPPHLVRHYLTNFGLHGQQQVLDPFCGTGTTLVESKKRGVASIGLEANPVVHFAAMTKLSWTIDPRGLKQHAAQIARRVQARLTQDARSAEAWAAETLRTFTPEQDALTISGSISPLPLHKVLILLEEIDRDQDHPYWAHERLALAKQTVHAFSNLRFGPEVGVSTRQRTDAPVVERWLQGVEAMGEDLASVSARNTVPATVLLGDARQLDGALAPESIHAVITSPPYPNEKDYSRTTRLEAVLLGFMGTRQDLRAQKSGMLVSNTRNVYTVDTDDRHIQGQARVQELAAIIEQRRLQLGKTSGFEKLYGRVVRLYFGGMARHFRELAPKLAPGAQLAYVVGDQASYFRVLIQTGDILAEIAREAGYDVIGTELFRTRISTVTGDQLREEALILQWNP